MVELEILISKLNNKDIKRAEIKKLAKEIRKDHKLAMELWKTREFLPRMLSVLIMDNKLLTFDLIQKLVNELDVQEFTERNHITEWLLANQLTKSKATIILLESWESHSHQLLRRLYWYYQARLRWTGKNPSDNTQNC